MDIKKTLSLAAVSMLVLIALSAVIVYAPKPQPSYPVTVLGIPIKDYVICYSSNQFYPRIWLYDEEGETIGQLIFRPDGETLPDDFMRADGTYDMFYHLQDFENCVDILRNSEVASISWTGSGGGNENVLFGYNEPVGGR